MCLRFPDIKICPERIYHLAFHPVADKQLVFAADKVRRWGRPNPPHTRSPTDLLPLPLRLEISVFLTHNPTKKETTAKSSPTSATSKSTRAPSPPSPSTLSPPPASTPPLTTAASASSTSPPASRQKCFSATNTMASVVSKCRIRIWCISPPSTDAWDGETSEHDGLRSGPWARRRLVASRCIPARPTWPLQA